jgi:hypothetical protein
MESRGKHMYSIVGSLSVLVWPLWGDGNGFYVHRLLLLSAILDMECMPGWHGTKSNEMKSTSFSKKKKKKKKLNR